MAQHTQQTVDTSLAYTMAQHNQQTVDISFLTTRNNTSNKPWTLHFLTTRMAQHTQQTVDTSLPHNTGHNTWHNQQTVDTSLAYASQHGTTHPTNRGHFTSSQHGTHGTTQQTVDTSLLPWHNTTNRGHFLPHNMAQHTQQTVDTSLPHNTDTTHPTNRGHFTSSQHRGHFLPHTHNTTNRGHFTSLHHDTTQTNRGHFLPHNMAQHIQQTVDTSLPHTMAHNTPYKPWTLHFFMPQHNKDRFLGTSQGLASLSTSTIQHVDKETLSAFIIHSKFYFNVRLAWNPPIKKYHVPWISCVTTGSTQWLDVMFHRYHVLLQATHHDWTSCSMDTLC